MSVFLVSVSTILLYVIFGGRIKEGGQPKVKKETYKVRRILEKDRNYLIQIQEQMDWLVIPKEQTEMILVEKEEMYLERITTNTYYVKKRILRKDQLFFGRQKVDYKLLIPKEKVIQ